MNFDCLIKLQHASSKMLLSKYCVCHFLLISIFYVGKYYVYCIDKIFEVKHIVFYNAIKIIIII